MSDPDRPSEPRLPGFMGESDRQLDRKYRRLRSERDYYYDQWKLAEEEILGVRSSLMWRITKTRTAIARQLGLRSGTDVPEKLHEAVEAAPPHSRKQRIARNTGISDERSGPVKLTPVNIDAEIERTEYERNGYRGEMQHARNRLETIHTSNLWRSWTPYRDFRARVDSRLESLRSMVEAAGNALAAVPKGVVRAAGFMPWLAGSAMTVVQSASIALRSRPHHPRAPFHVEKSEPMHPGAASRRPRVLIVSPYHIHPPNHGSGVRLSNLVRELSATCDLYLLIFCREGENPIERRALEPYCRRVDFHPWVPDLRHDLFGLRPAIAEVFRSDRVGAKIRDIVTADDIDVVQLEHTELAQYHEKVPDGVPVVLTEHDIAFRSHRRRRSLGFHTRFPEARVLRTSALEILRIFRYEIHCCHRVQRIHVMSEIDGTYLGRYLRDGSNRIVVAPNGVDTEAFAADHSGQPRSGVLFLGNFNHLPNIDAIEFLIRDVWPLLRLRVPDAELTVVGTNPPERVKTLGEYPGVRLIGEVPDPRAYYHSRQVMVAPIRAGSGTRLKILEAFAAGIPVVSTTLGAEGIDAVDGTHLLLADRAIGFARAIERLLRDEELCRFLAQNARELVRSEYDWRIVARRMTRDYNELVSAAAERPRPAHHSAANPAFRILADGAAVTDPEVSIVIPTLNGGRELERCLESIDRQRTSFDFEVVCVDSGSSAADIEVMRRSGARVAAIDRLDFNHGWTRDLGASLARAPIVVFLNQDAIPIRNDWLELLVAPLRHDADDRIAAVQGGSREDVNGDRRFFWGTGGERFYFTRESRHWIERFEGIGFSTTSCAIRRSVWRRHRFGEASILEDKKWQREVIDAGYDIVPLPEVRVFHSHDYDLKSLLRRCASEGHGWRRLGERYPLPTAIADIFTRSVWRELGRGLARKEVRSVGELAFPVLRPLSVWLGNRFLRRVLH